MLQLQNYKNLPKAILGIPSQMYTKTTGTYIPVMYEHETSIISKCVCYSEYAATNNKTYHPVQGFALKLPTAGDKLACMLWSFQSRVQPE